MTDDAILQGAPTNKQTDLSTSQSTNTDLYNPLTLRLNTHTITVLIKVWVKAYKHSHITLTLS